MQVAALLLVARGLLLSGSLSHAMLQPGRYRFLRQVSSVAISLQGLGAVLILRPIVGPLPAALLCFLLLGRGGIAPVACSFLQNHPRGEASTPERRLAMLTRPWRRHPN